MKTAFNKKFLNLTVDLTNWKNKTRKNPPTLSLAIDAWLFRDMTNAMLMVKVKHVQSGNVLFDQSVNVCQFSKLRNNMMSKGLFNEINKNVAFKIECPFRKGNYQVKSGPFSEQFFPSFIQPDDPFETRIEIKSKVGNRLESLAVLTQKWEILETKDDSK
ncbi:unnamed protein product [Diamesa tonsa]